MSTRWTWRTAAVLSLLLSGCQRNHYKIEMRADGEVLERKLTLGDGTESAENEIDEQKENDDPDPELDSIVSLYQKRLSPPNAKKHVFLGKFFVVCPQGLQHLPHRLEGGII